LFPPAQRDLNAIALILPDAGASCFTHKNVKHHAPCWYASRREGRAIPALVAFCQSHKERVGLAEKRLQVSLARKPDLFSPSHSNPSPPHQCP